MKILLHLDPLDNDSSMIQNRLDVYSEMMNELTSIGASVYLYLNSIHLSKAQKKIANSLLIHDDWPNTSLYGYKSLAYANNLPPSLVEDSHKIYKRINFKPDLIITNTPSSLIRKTWHEELILHYELGYFNRPPFPKFFQFDPIGYYHSSLLAKYPYVGEIGTKKEMDELEKKKEEILNLMGINLAEVGTVDATYIPIHSESWATKTEYNYSNKIDSILQYAKENKNKTIFTNEKPQVPLTAFEREQLSRHKNINLMQNDDIYGIGSKLALICKETYTFSPSLGLQAIFWGNKLISPIQSSMVGWASLESPEKKLAPYISNFHISDFKRIPHLINTWNKYNPYNSNGRKQ